MVDDLDAKKKALTDKLVRGEIAKAAVQLLNEGGLEGLTMDRVAETAGVAKGTLYNYFKNKEDLLIHVNEALFECHWRDLEAIQGGSDSPKAAIAKAVGAMFHHFAANRNVLIAFHDGVRQNMSMKHFSDGIRARRQRSLALLKTLIEEATRRGEFRQMDAQIAAEALLGSIIGQFRGSAWLGSTFDPEERANWTLSIFFQGFEPRERTTNSL